MTTERTSLLFLGRQPILDRQQNLFAYELLFRSNTRNAARFPDSSLATATVIANTFSEISIGDTLGNCRGFIKVEVDFLFSDMLLLLPPDSAVLEILDSVPLTVDVLSRCRDLKNRGFLLAMDGHLDGSAEHHELLSLADYLKVDTQRIKGDELAHLTQQLAAFGKDMVAEKVHTKARMEQCLALGFAYFQGYYFARPTILSGRKLDHSQTTLMRLLSLLMSDADTSELENALKPEPVLILNLLRMTNSVGAGTRIRITSLRHAITILGRRQLQRWLQLLLFAAHPESSTNNPLLHLAATRGRLMELLAGIQKKGNTAYADSAFMVGIMSLMPTLMGLPMEEIVAPLGMTSEVRSALCKNEGMLGKLLLLVSATESDSAEEMEDLMGQCPGLSADILNQCQTQALTWASSINRSAED